MASDDEDDLETTMTSGSIPAVDPTREIHAILDDLENLLKNGEVIAALTSGSVNASLALVAVQGLRSLLSGNKAAAADDFDTVAEEMRSRRAGGSGGPRGKRPREGRRS